MTEPDFTTPQSNASHGVAVQRLVRRLERRDGRIAGLERKIRRLEEALSWRTIGLESLSRNIRREVQDALCNVRMISVNGLAKTSSIVETRSIPANSKLYQPNPE